MANMIDLTGDENDESRPIRLDSGDEEEDLKLAIAISLQEQEIERAKLSQKSDAEASKGLEPMREPLIQESKLNESNENKTKIPHGILGLDRKQMEQERLARLKRKRDKEWDTTSRVVPPPPLQKVELTNVESKSTINEASRALDLATTTTKSVMDFPYSHGKVMLTSQSSQQCISSEIRQNPSSMSFHDLITPTRPDIPLRSAFLSSFTVDFDWLLPYFDTRNVSFVFALHSANQEHRALLQQDFAGVPNVKLVLPPINSRSPNGVNCMHSKMMLLFYGDKSKEDKEFTSGKARCRIVIPSANLVPFDYGVGKTMENTIFVIDLPLAADEPNCMLDTVFKTKLVAQLLALGTPPAVVKKLDAFDFSKTANLGFVHSIGGSHFVANNNVALSEGKQQKQTKVQDFFSAAMDEKDHKSNSTERIETLAYSPAIHEVEESRTGLLSLSDTIKELHLDVDVSNRSGTDNVNTAEGESSYPITIDYVTSSLGSLDLSFLQSLYVAACGHEPEQWTISSSRTDGSKAKLRHNDGTLQKFASPNPTYELVKKHLRIYFPSDETVRSSRGGPKSAGTICFKSKWWTSNQQRTSNKVNTDFPRDCLQDCIGARRDGILMHSKILYVRYRFPKLVERPDGSEVFYVGWAYVGSANLGESAWGKISLDSKTKHKKIMCRNWESGVIIPVQLDMISHPYGSSNSNNKSMDLSSMTLEEVFGALVPVPMVYPGTNLVESRRLPWFFEG